MDKQSICFIALLSTSETLGQQIKDLPLKTIMKSIQSSKNVNPSWVEDQNATLLDIFGDVSKDILTNKMIPATTAACDWDWMHLRCEPFCNCSYQPLFGDYHLGRSCRSRDIEINKPPSSLQKDPGTAEQTASDGERFLKLCNEPPNTNAYTFMNGLRIGIKFIWLKIDWRERVVTAKHKVCDSLFDVDGRDGHSTGGPRDTETQSLMEKPVRAIRKSLRCDESLVINVDSGDETTVQDKSGTKVERDKTTEPQHSSDQNGIEVDNDNDEEHQV
jgi:hypothetical protein